MELRGHGLIYSLDRYFEAGYPRPGYISLAGDPPYIEFIAGDPWITYNNTGGF